MRQRNNYHGRVPKFLAEIEYGLGNRYEEILCPYCQKTMMQLSKRRCSKNKRKKEIIYRCPNCGEVTIDEIKEDVTREIQYYLNHTLSKIDDGMGARGGCIQVTTTWEPDQTLTISNRISTGYHIIKIAEGEEEYLDDVEE